MASGYQILGRTVPAHYLSMATLGGVTLICLPKPWGPAAPQHPPINAASEEEEKFIKEYLTKNLKH